MCRKTHWEPKECVPTSKMTSRLAPGNLPAKATILNDVHCWCSKFLGTHCGPCPDSLIMNFCRQLKGRRGCRGCPTATSPAGVGEKRGEGFCSTLPKKSLHLLLKETAKDW